MMFRMQINPKFMRTQSNLSSMQYGFSLVELMIGLTLGLIAAAAIFASLSAFEKQRRTIGSGADMQQNGLLALYAIEQDTRDAGYGLIDTTSKPGNLPCSTINAYLPTLYASAVPAASSVWAVTPDAATGAASVGSSFNSSPVIISDGTGSNGSDTITIHSFGSDTGGIVTGGQAAVLAGNAILQSQSPLQAGAINVGPISVDTELTFHKNDFILIADSGSCGLLQVTGSSAGNLNTQEVDNPAGTPTSIVQSDTYNTSTLASVINLGQPASSVLGNACPLATKTASGANRVGNPSSDAAFARACSAPLFGSSLYQVDDNHDLVLSKDGTAPTAIASGIVDIQAQYGVSDAGSQAVTCWTDAAGTGCNISAGNWSAPVYADVIRIKAIRVAIVARSAKKESCDTTTADPITWTQPATNPASSAAPLISLSTSVGNDWQCYRYKVYQTIVPLRNVIWGAL
jgi:type IV pilus assembly protein PilW